MKVIGMTPLSSIALSAYTDLVRLLKDEAMSGVEGKPTLKQRGDKAYWYAARRVGVDMRFFYIGEDNEEMRARIERSCGEVAGPPSSSSSSESPRPT